MKNIRGKLPDERIELGDMIPWDTEGAEAIIHGLMRCFDIEEHEKTYKSAQGEATLPERIIRIPTTLDSPKKFIVSLHEIGHIKFSTKKYKFDYMMEYDAEQYAIGLAKTFGFIRKKSIESYIKSARIYVLSYINRDIKKIKIKDIPIEVVEWINDPELNSKFYE